MAVHLPPHGPSQNPEGCLSMQKKKVKCWNLWIFFEILDFSFYNIQYIFFSLWESGLSDFYLDHGVIDALPLISNIFSEHLMIAFQNYSQKTEKIENFQNNFLHLLSYFKNYFIPIPIFSPHSFTQIPCIVIQLFCFPLIYLQIWKFFSINLQ